MIAIVNIDPNLRKKGKHKYQLRINHQVICEFYHFREKGLSECLRQAATAYDTHLFADYTGYLEGTKERPLTPKEEAIIQYLRSVGDWVSPTEIGQKVGGGKRHSAWASPTCKRLVARGILKRSINGWYSIK